MIDELTIIIMQDLIVSLNFKSIKTTNIFGEIIIYGQSLSDAKMALRTSTYILGLNQGYKQM